MNTAPDQLYYTSSHEWVRKENDNTVTIGVTQHAQELLGDIVFVDLPTKDTTVSQGDETAVVESVKTAADIYAPLNGTVIETNNALTDTPELINSDPYGEGWIYRLTISDESLLNTLLSAAEYTSTVNEN